MRSRNHEEAACRSVALKPLRKPTAVLTPCEDTFAPGCDRPGGNKVAQGQNLDMFECQTWDVTWKPVHNNINVQRNT